MAALRRCFSKLKIRSVRNAGIQCFQKSKQQEILQLRSLSASSIDVTCPPIHPASFCLTHFSRTCSTSSTAPAVDVDNSCILRLDNLPKTISRDQVQMMLEKHGKLQECHKEAFAALVAFSKPNVAAMAVENLDGITFNGITMKIERSETNKNIVLIKNLPEDWEINEVTQLCAPYGEVTNVKIKSKWTARFATSREAQRAAENVNATTCEDWIVSATTDKPKKKWDVPGPYELIMEKSETAKMPHKGLDEGECHDEPDDLYRKIVLEIKGHDAAVLDSYIAFVKMTCKFLNVNLQRVYTPPKVYTRYTLLKSAHVHKKHMVHYEMRSYYKIVELEKLTGSTAITFLEYIERNLPEGIAMKVTKHQLQTLPEYVKPPEVEQTV